MSWKPLDSFRRNLVITDGIRVIEVFNSKGLNKSNLKVFHLIDNASKLGKILLN